MEQLDNLVTTSLLDRLLAPERLSVIVGALAARRAERAAAVEERIKGLEQRATDADERLRRLYALVEVGLTDLDDILKERIGGLREDRDAARTALDRARIANRPPAAIEPTRIEAFGRSMREQLTMGAIPFRKAYLGAILDRVAVHRGLIRIIGRKDVLA